MRLWGSLRARWTNEGRERQEEEFRGDVMSWYELFKKEDATLVKEDRSRFAKLKVPPSALYELKVGNG